MPSNNNEDSSKSNQTGNAGWPHPTANLGGKVQELNDTVSRIRQEAEDQIRRAKQESEEKSKTIAKLQLQLEQQSDYDLLKREVQ